MKVTALVFIFSACFSQSLAQCLTKDDENTPTSELTRETLYRGQQTFTLSVFDAINKHQGKQNVFFSPFSVYHALLLAYFASGNETERSLKQALHLGNETKLDVMKAYKLDQYLRSAAPRESYEFNSANRVYVSKELPVRECITDFLNDEFETLDFKGNVESSRVHINDWVSNVTKRNIQDLIPAGQMDSSTELVIANAAYFKGVWVTRFPAENTAKEVFYVTPDKQTFVEMMKLKGKFNHGVSEQLGAHILELPYKGEEVSMFVLLPPFANPQGVDNILEKLNPESLSDVVDEGALMGRQVELQLPKFTMEKTLELKPILETVGVGDLFEPTSDFSWLTGVVGPHFTEASHKAKIRLDEDGTVAAAATAMFSFRSSRPAEPAVFICNHPFVYFLYDKPTRTVTFMGVFRDPKDNN